MLNDQGGNSSLRNVAGYFILFFLCASVFAGCANADQAADVPGHNPAMFHADPWHSGINDDGGIRPAGSMDWTFTTGDRVYSSPAVVDGVVYVGSDDNKVYALDAASGSEKWSYLTGGRVLTSPAVVNGIVYVGSYDKNLYALDAATGTKLWSFTMKGWVTADPVVTDGVVYSGSLNDKLYAINASTGTELWNASLGAYPSVDSSPAVANGVVYVTGGEKILYALDESTGGILWSFTLNEKISGSPSVANNIVYVGCNDDNLYALDASTGATIWNYTAGGDVQSCPAVTGNIVYFGSGDNNVYALNASTGVKIWNFTTGSVVFSSPTFANGVVYVGSWDHNLYALDALTGEKIWNYTTGSVVFSSPAVANGLVYFGSLDNNIYSVGSAPGAANLMLGISGSAFHENASAMNYTISYLNKGNSPAENVVLVDHLPPSVVYLSGTGSPVYDSGTRTVTWEMGGIPSFATGSQSITVFIPSSVSYDRVLNNTVTITTTTKETRGDDNTAYTLTTVKEKWLPSQISVAPSVPGPWGGTCVFWLDPITFSFNQTNCPEETPVSISIHIDDGGPDITAPMVGGPRVWNYSTTFYPRYGAATVSFLTPGCVISGITIPITIEPSGYIYDTSSGKRIQGANVRLQWPDAEGNWVHVPTGLIPSPMQPDQNPVTTNSAGQYQWNVTKGSYRVYVEAEGHRPAATSMVNSPPPFSEMNVGLEPTNGDIWVSSTPTGAQIYLDGNNSGHTTTFLVPDVSAGQHAVVLKLAGYQDYQETVTVTAGKTTTVRGNLTAVSPGANFTADATSGFIPMAVQFTDSSMGTPPLEYLWNFGDGTPDMTGSNPLHTYTTEGTYNVTLTVSNSAGTSTLVKPGYIVAMEEIIDGGGKGYYLIHSNADGADVYFNGDWYEGKIENGTLLVETCLTCTPVWTYTVKKCGYFALTQNNTKYPGKDQVIDLYANLTRPKEPVLPDFSANITTGPVPLPVGFTSSSIGIAEAWNWSFGDGTYSEERDPVHTYTADGVYTVSLHVSNSACQNNTVEKIGYITAGTVPKPPLFADFTVSPVYGSAPLTVKCNDKSIGNPGMIAYDFGDGGLAMGPNPTHTYRLPGAYTITQTITKYNTTTNTVMSSVATKPDAITVFKAIPLPPFARFTASPVTGPAPLTVTFTDQSMASPIMYTYDFGDGINSTSRNPVHTYRFPGVYNVSLLVVEYNAGTGSMLSDSYVRNGLIVVNGT
ncbi:MAG: PQQ-binding-like beta-propeller repeat protein [Methanomicrobiales archaeon]